ncbi:MAG: DNA-processing protein DprA [Ilumatobacteraceae bacterium]
MTEVPDAGYVAALAGFRGMTPRRLRILTDHLSPSDAFDVASGAAPPTPYLGRLLNDELRGWWRQSAAERPPAACWERCVASGVKVLTAGDPAFPAMLHLDPSPPAVLFVRGDLAALDARRVGIVGTRNATRLGRETAAGLGLDLAASGVAVVSGLARGIDGAAHRGALAAGCQAAGASTGPAIGRPVAVVGNGPDAAYPKQHAELWSAVSASGVLMSEWPPGTPPDGFRFPMRNRILAALCEVLVVVESRETGGSLLTAREALDRSVEVMAVPGSPRSRASAGTNGLLRDGAAPVTSADDVLAALGLDTRRQGTLPFDPRPPLRGVDRVVIDHCRADPRTLDEIAAELGVGLCDAAMTLARLERTGWLREVGGWFEALGSRSELA